MGGPGSGGHNRKPATIHKLHGTHRRGRHRGADGVPLGIQPEKVAQNPPRWLSRHGKRFWRQHRDQCVEMGTLDALSCLLFEALCDTYGHLRELDDAIREAGQVIETPKGPKPHPLLSLRNSTERELTRGMAEFGLTPAGRKRLGITWPDETEDEDPFEQWVSREST